MHYMKYKFGANIPTDYRTLLRTPVKPIESVMEPGGYIHVGVRKALNQLLSEVGPFDHHTSEYSYAIFRRWFVDFT